MLDLSKGFSKDVEAVRDQQSLKKRKCEQTTRGLVFPSIYIAQADGEPETDEELTRSIAILSKCSHELGWFSDSLHLCMLHVEISPSILAMLNT